ncbi:uncharacterized protein PGTG_03777 [Puccinia graminis f. sp. tritici CRL 75-36-700-3]|uniref:Pericentrin/AKAP-450 centrosomal targeting domain-containing protein n=1 Tax=Puccinia graminis f. sp. tritici (strain CRL 75-36-700-3 / race SCCL) TaxID=418459 RepID=E3K0J6_PUCGT|nr:uncharacterized protein PGTG_03777 [Puccinia graminis f. sp. tritici CRL 75-36-700-3]EFP77821.2 hypothetical protein PGTG_03777 [Puccinia graminis f. sp. tritici CRL 75-36-700-3]
MAFPGYQLDTPARLMHRIDRAEELEEGLDSLPSWPPPDPTSVGESFGPRGPGHIYDVGISRNTTMNTPFIPRTEPNRFNTQDRRPAFRERTHQSNANRTQQSHARFTPRPGPSNHQPTNMDQPQITVDSPLTSTPATANPARHAEHWLRDHSPNTSHIPQTQDHRPEVGILTSSSETETDQPPPDTLHEDSSSSDGDQDDPSNKSLGDLNLSALDDLESGFDTSQSPENQRENYRSVQHQKTSSSVIQPQPKSGLSSSSSSHSTLQARLSRTNSRDRDLATNRSPREPSGSQLTSPGVGRRDSFRVDNSLTIDEIGESFSREMSHEFEGSKKSSFGRSPVFQPEPVLNPDNHRRQSIMNPSNLSRMRDILKSNGKPIPSQMPFRSARRPFTPRRLNEVADDTTDFSGIPSNQSNHPNNPQPVQVAGSESEATSHDLTTFPGARHQNGSSSFSFADRSTRFNGNKLNSFLHDLNGHLSEENHQIVNALAETKARLAQLEMENQSLRRGVLPPQSDADGALDRSGVLQDHLQGMINVHDSIAELQSNFNPAQAEDNYASQSESASQNLLSERQIHRLEYQLEERDEEIREIRNQLLNKAPLNSSSLKQIFELKDRLKDLQAVLASKEDEVDQLKLQQIEIVGQHASTLAECNAQHEKDLVDAKAGYDLKIATLKDQATALIQEKDRMLVSMNSKYKEVRRLTDVQGKAPDEPKSTQSTGQSSLETLLTVKSELEQVLNGKGDQSVGRSAERRIRMLHSWIQSEISNNEQKTSQDDPEPAKQSEVNRQSPQEKDELRAKIEELGLELSEKDYRIEALEVSLKDSEDARQAVESDYAQLETQVDVLEAETIAQQSTISGLQAKLSQALKSNFSDVSSTPGRLSPKRESGKNNSELSKAQEEINRLKTLISQSDNAATCEIQNMKIEALETQRRELEERVGSLRQQTSALISTPSRSSCHFQSIISMRTPKTPGKMLSNMTSILAGDSGDETIVPMLNQIHELQQQVEQLRHQLDLANKNVDHKLAKLSEVSENVVKVSTEAITARRRADDFEEKAQKLEERLDKLIAEDGTIAQVKHRLSNIGCPDCGERFDANQIVRFRVLPETQELEFTEQPTENDTEDHSSGLKVKFMELEANHQTSQTEIIKLKRELDLKLDELEKLESEKATQEQEIEQLQNRLSEARDEVESLLSKSQEQQERLQENEKEREALSDDKEDLEDQLEAANLKLHETEAQLSQVTEARDSMDAEIRALHTQKKESSASSAKIEQLQETISKLETENAEYAEQHSSLTAEVRQLKTELERKAHTIINSEKSYHRVQATLEKRTLDFGQLEDELERKTNEIMGLNETNNNLLKDTKALRKELIKVKAEAQDLGHHLQDLKDQVDRQASAPNNSKEMTKLKNELSLCKKELNELKSQRAQGNHGLTNETREELDHKHNSESKGLLLRIRFLKLMFTRESLFRADLACQKKLIMLKLRQTEIRNEAIQLALSNFGLPYSSSSGDDDTQHPGNFTLHPTSTDRTFKSVALAVRAICKLKMLSKNWNKEVKVKEKLKEAYREVRGKEFIGD